MIRALPNIVETGFCVKPTRCLHLLVALLALLLSGQGEAAPLGSAFTYQGHLSKAGAPASGHFDLRFDLFATATGGNPSALTLTNADLAVSNGLFNATLDFGRNVFDGSSCWLEIAVRPAGTMN